MSTEVEDQLSEVQPENLSTESSKKPKRSYSRESLLSLSELEVCKKLPNGFDESLLRRPKRSYTREFLLSLGELEVCKKLPNGFDESLLSEFDDTSRGVQDRQRVPSLQGFRRTDYGSSVSSRGDSGDYTRGLHRWDSRSSGRSDTDSDSESGRHFGSQARRSWQNAEHDGLLGSGSFPRPAGYAAGTSVPRFRPNETFHLNKSNEPYHPPRPYKAVPHSRRETNDSYNDETFGSTDNASEDRVEEEKKRRAEFELMRKEQQKAFQEKQKLNPGKPEDPFSGIAELPENPSDSKIFSSSDKIVKQAPHDDSSKVPFSSQALPSRPVVPPGFVSSIVDKNSTAKCLVNVDQSEVRILKLEDSHQDVKNRVQERVSSDLYCSSSIPSAIKDEKVVDISSVLQGADQAKPSCLSDVSGVLDNGEIVQLDFEVDGHKELSEPAHSTSILDKLFGNASAVSSCNTLKFVEGRDAEADDIWSPNTLQSKFAHWFVEEDKKPLGDISSEKPNNLLSLIVGGEKGGFDVHDATPVGSIFTLETFMGPKTSNSASSIAEISKRFSDSNVPEPKPSVLTCEDLEQSILSEIGESPNSQTAGEEHHGLEVRGGQPDADVNNQASQHLLSLLQRGMEQKNMPSISIVEESPDTRCSHEVAKIGVLDGNINHADAEGLTGSGKTLTLEALFGTTFMKELHSAQTNSVGSARADVSDSALFPAMNEIGNGAGGHDGTILASNDESGKLGKVGDWLGFHDAGKEVEVSERPAEVNSKFGGSERGLGVTLPEEDSLISLIDPTNAENLMLIPNSSSSNTDLFSLSSTPVNVIEKLAVLGGGRKDERSMVGGQDPLMLRNPYDMVKPQLPYQTLHSQASPPQLHAPQMDHSRQMFHGLDAHPAHLDPHFKFMPPEAVVHYDAPTHHQFPANVSHPSFPHLGAGLPRLDQTIPPPILQQMHMGGNLPPPHLVRGFPGAPPMPPHPGHNPAGYSQEHNPMQGFPFGRQPNFGGPGMTPTGPELSVANNQPEALQRLLEMELRASPSQMHPCVAGGPSRAMYGHELDMGFRYR